MQRIYEKGGLNHEDMSIVLELYEVFMSYFNFIIVLLT